jgi:plastocyanin domain-containing protein
LSVTERGFEPATIRLRKDEPVVLAITRRTDRTCAKEIVAEELGVRADLPLQTTVRIAMTPRNAGRIRFGCGMGKMISGNFEIA